MEDNQQQQEQQQPLFGLEVDHLSKSNLNEASRWARFIAITGFVGLGVVVLLFAIAGAQIADRFSELFRVDAGAGSVLIVVILVAIAICTLWLYFLYKASNLIKKGILASDQKMFNEGLQALKVYFTIGLVFGILGLLGNLMSLF